MTSFTLSFEFFSGVALEYEVNDRTLIWPGYDLEDEHIAHSLVGELPSHLLFMLGTKALLQDIGEKNYSDLFHSMMVLETAPLNERSFDEKPYNVVYELAKYSRHQYCQIAQTSSPQLLSFLATLKDSSLEWDIARNPATKAAVLAKIARRSDYIQIQVALNESTDLETLRYLANIPDLSNAIMRHSVHGPTLQNEYLNDPRPEVRRSIARFTKNPLVMKALAVDSDPFVRKNLLDNTGLTLELRQELTLLEQAPLDLLENLQPSPEFKAPQDKEIHAL